MSQTGSVGFLSEEHTSNPFEGLLCQKGNFPQLRMMWPGVITITNSSPIAATQTTTIGMMIRSLYRRTIRALLLILYRSVLPLIEILGQIITPPPPNWTVSCTSGGLFHVPGYHQMNIHLLSGCTLNRDLPINITLLYSSRSYLRCSCAHLLQVALWSSVTNHRSAGIKTHMMQSIPNNFCQNCGTSNILRLLLQ